MFFGGAGGGGGGGGTKRNATILVGPLKYDTNKCCFSIVFQQVPEDQGTHVPGSEAMPNFQVVS